jgi:hypothetical protein
MQVRWCGGTSLPLTQPEVRKSGLDLDGAVRRAVGTNLRIDQRVWFSIQRLTASGEDDHEVSFDGVPFAVVGLACRSLLDMRNDCR